MRTAACDEIQTIAIGKSEIDDERIMKAFERQSLCGLGIPGSIDLVSCFGQRTA